MGDPPCGPVRARPGAKAKRRICCDSSQYERAFLKAHCWIRVVGAGARFGLDIWLECTRLIGCRRRECRSGFRLQLDIPLMGFFAQSEFSGFRPIRFVFGDGQDLFRAEEKLSDLTNLPPSSRT